MRAIAIAFVLAVVLFVGAACTPRVEAPGVAAPTPGQALPPDASGKIGAAQAGAVSPVPAFRAVGDHWRLLAEGTEGLRLSARLQRDGRGEQNVTLVYDPRGANAVPRTHVLAGTLYGDGAQGDREIRVTLVRATCRNREGEHAWRAGIVLEDGEALAGCADVAT